APLVPDHRLCSPSSSLNLLTTSFEISRSMAARSISACARRPLAPPSFPTRRSSDLVPGLDLGAVELRAHRFRDPEGNPEAGDILDRKSTRLNSSHVKISYAVFCLKKKKKKKKHKNYN